jgi:hypothetical protein
MAISASKRIVSDPPLWVYSACFGNWDVDSFSLTQEQAEEKASLLASQGVNAVILFWRGKGKEYRHIVFDSLLFGKGFDFDAVYHLLSMIVNACHKYGIKVVEHHGIAFVHHNPEKPLYRKKIDQIYYKGLPVKKWCQFDMLRKKISMGWYSGYMFCPNNPYYREAVYSHYIPATLATSVDGIMMDDVQITPDWYTCGCFYCQKKFQEETGFTLPKDVKDESFWGNFQNPAFRAWIRFRMKSTGDFYEDLAKQAFAIKKDLLSFTCSSSTISTWGAQACGSDLYEWIRGMNAVFKEILYVKAVPYSIPSTAVNLKTYQALAREWKLPSITIFYPSNEEENYLYWSLSKSWDQLYWPCPKLGAEEKLGDMNFLLWERENKELFTGTKQSSGIGVLFSKQTRDIYGGPEDSYYVKEYRGWCETMVRNNIQFDTLLDFQITSENLKKYGLLILPNSACLSKEQVKVIRGFVQSGGNLIATFETSLYDENGDKLDNFALKDVLGVNYIKKVSEVLFPVSLKEEQPGFSDIRRRIENRAPVLFVKDRGKNLKRLMKINTESVIVEHPFLTSTSFGKGKVIYCAGKPGLMSYTPSVSFRSGESLTYVEDRRIPEYSQLILNAIRSIYPESSSYTWENLPEGIFLTIYEKKGLKILHLVNAVGTLLEDNSVVVSSSGAIVGTMQKKSLTASKEISQLDTVGKKAYTFAYKELKGKDIILTLPCKVKNAEILSPEIEKKKISVKQNGKKSTLTFPINLIKRYALLLLKVE